MHIYNMDDEKSLSLTRDEVQSRGVFKEDIVFPVCSKNACAGIYAL